VSFDELKPAVAAIGDLTGRDHHDVAVVLGSGLSDYASRLPGATEAPYGSIPGFPVPAVEGHTGSLISAEIGGKGILVLAGRVHTYEGWAMEDVVFGVRAALLAGCRTLVLTNAAGGVGDGLSAGDLVLITDHINLTGRNPLTGANDDRLGPRFPDMSAVYSAELRSIARVAGASTDVDLQEGIYAWFLGPSYETPAEVQMAKRLGADLVGMSTVPEAIAARHMGAGVLGISLVTNLAAGISATPLSHDEVQETAAEARGRFTSLLDQLLADLTK
jgi:purine-nucleoside phosphorylase